MDHLSPEARSRLMASIRGRDTKPERAVQALLRGVLRGSGLRVRAHMGSLPGRPDFAVPAARVAIFVHGCFWHRHQGCRLCSTPSTRRRVWQAKFTANVRRDHRATRALRALGWRVVVVWECRLRHPERVRRRLERAFARDR